MRSYLLPATCCLALLGLFGCRRTPPATAPAPTVAIPDSGATVKPLGGAGHAGNTAPVASAEPCRVTGQIRSSELEKLGGSIKRAVASAPQQQKTQPAARAKLPAGRFEIHLPPGEHKVRCTAIGTRGETFNSVTLPVTVKEGQKDLDLGVIDLSPSVTTRLYGQPAPELEGVAAWMNTEPLTLSGLRGKVVVLAFWAYYDPISASNLTHLDRLQKHMGVAALTVHTNTVATSEQLKERIKGRPKFEWKKELTLPTAVDGKGLKNVFRAYGVAAVPAVILIAPDGRVVRRFANAGDPALEAEVRRLLKETHP
jgi:hypothetical protein